MSNFELELFAKEGCNCVGESQDADKHWHKSHATKDTRQNSDEAS